MLRILDLLPPSLTGELEDLARATPVNGEDIVKQVYQWRHDTLKTWALALFAGALTFISAAAIAALKMELKASSLSTYILVGAGAAAIVSATVILFRLQRLVSEYLLAVQLFLLYRAIYD